MNNWTQQFQEYLLQGHPLAYPIAYLFGFLASLTPCIYPMIPVTVGYMAHIGRTRKRIWIYAGVYVLGMAVTYTALGMFAALTGKIFGAMTTNPYIFFIVGIIFLICGLAMLGVISFDSLLAKISAVGTKSESHGLVGACLLGVTSGFIAAPCTAPILGVLLSYVVMTKNILYGGSILFAFSLGLGTLLFLVATFSGLTKYLPKGGNWTKIINYTFGSIFLFFSVYLFIRAMQLF